MHMRVGSHPLRWRVDAERLTSYLGGTCRELEDTLYSNEVEPGNAIQDFAETFGIVVTGRRTLQPAFGGGYEILLLREDDGARFVFTASPNGKEDG